MKKRTFWDRVMTAVKAQDANAVKEELESKDADETEEEKEAREAKEAKKETGDSLAKLTATVDSLVKVVGRLVKDAKAKDDDEEKKKLESEDDDDGDEDKDETTDTVLEAEEANSNKAAVGNVLSGDSMKAVIARAEILAPGIAIPTGDAAKAKDAAAKVQHKALETAYATESGKAAIEPFLAGREIKALTGDALASVFTGAAELMRAQNNDRGARKTSATRDFGPTSEVSAINARNRDFWANRSAR